MGNVTTSTLSRYYDDDNDDIFDDGGGSTSKALARLPMCATTQLPPSCEPFSTPPTRWCFTAVRWKRHIWSNASISSANLAWNCISVQVDPQLLFVRSLSSSPTLICEILALNVWNICDPQLTLYVLGSIRWGYRLGSRSDMNGKLRCIIPTLQGSRSVARWQSIWKVSLVVPMMASAPSQSNGSLIVRHIIGNISIIRFTQICLVAASLERSVLRITEHVDDKLRTSTMERKVAIDRRLSWYWQINDMLLWCLIEGVRDWIGSNCYESDIDVWAMSEHVGDAKEVGHRIVLAGWRRFLPLFVFCGMSKIPSFRRSTIRTP